MSAGRVLRAIARGFVFRLRIAGHAPFAYVLVVPILQTTLVVYLFRSGDAPGNLLYAAIGAAYVGMWSRVVYEGGGAITSSASRSTSPRSRCSRSPCC